MAYLFLDDSKHHPRGFSLAAFVICETNPQTELRSIIANNGFDPATFEFKSSLSMRDVPSLQQLRSDLKSFIRDKCNLAVCIVTGDKNLGEASLYLLQKVLKHQKLAEKPHNVFFDEGLFSSKTTAIKQAAAINGLEKCHLYFEQNSKDVSGIQVADLAAHTCATMLSETLGLIEKMVEIDHPGYPYVGKVSIGFELWAEMRSTFLSENKTNDPDSQDFALLNVEPYGLYIHESASKTLAKAAQKRFREMYVGCIH